MTFTINGSDLTRAGNAVDWEKLLQFLAGDYGSFVSVDSVHSQSEIYRYGRPVFFEKSELQITASLDRAAELVAVMPETARKMLLAPIKHGLLDLQSVFYLKDVTRDEKIAICVEDFLRLVSCYFVNSVEEQDFSTEALDIDLSDAEFPTRLLCALSLILEGESEYASADTDSSTGYSNCEADNHMTPISPPSLPSTRPPTVDFQSKQLYQSAHSICNQKRAIIFSIILIIILTTIAGIAIYFVNQQSRNSNPSISVKFVNKSHSFPILHLDRVIVAFDYENQMAIVTSVDVASTTTLASGFSWNGSSGHSFNFTVREQFIHCGVYAFYKTERVYCCCKPAVEFCNFPDKEGIFRNSTLSGLDYMYTKLHDFQYFNQHPTFAFFTQYRPDNSDESYFLLFFLPDDKRLLSHSEIYDIRENMGHWRLIAAPQIRRTVDHSVEMLLEIIDSANNTIKYVMCKYDLGLSNGTLHRNGCIELENLKIYMDRTNTYAASFHPIVNEGIELYMVALFTETPPTNSDSDKQISLKKEKTNVLGQLPLIAYNIDGKVVASTSYKFQTSEVTGQYIPLGSPLITDNHLFVYLQNSASYDGYLLQYEFDLPTNDGG